MLPGYSGRNRTFFFVNYEGARIRRGNTSTTTVPTARMREGDFTELGRTIRDPLTGNLFPNAIIPANRISPIARNAIRLADYPLQNVAGIRNNYTIAPSARNDLNQLVTRVDQSFSEKDKILGYVLLGEAGHRLAALYANHGRAAGRHHAGVLGKLDPHLPPRRC